MCPCSSSSHETTCKRVAVKGLGLCFKEIVEFVCQGTDGAGLSRGKWGLCVKGQVGLVFKEVGMSSIGFGGVGVSIAVWGWCTKGTGGMLKDS